MSRRKEEIRQIQSDDEISDDGPMSDSDISGNEIHFSEYEFLYSLLELISLYSIVSYILFRIRRRGTRI